MDLHAYLRYGSAERRLYMCHRNADADAICTARLLQRAYGGRVGLSGGMLQDAEAILTRLNFRADEEVLDFEPYDEVVVVDCYNASQLQVVPPRFVLVDHHDREALNQGAELHDRAEQVFWKPTPSCSILVYTWLLEAGEPLEEEDGLLALCGFVQDGGMQQRATPEWLRCVADLMQRHSIALRDAERLLLPLRTSPGPAMRCLREGEVIRVGERSVFAGTLEVKDLSFAVRHALVRIGFDACVLLVHEGEYGAVHVDFARQYIHDGTAHAVMRRVRSAFPGAAVWRSGLEPQGSLELAFRRCIEILSGGIARTAHTTVSVKRDGAR